MKGIFFILLAMIMLSTACEKHEGCTHPLADNFDRDADENDQSCTFSAVFSFYMTQYLAEEFAHEGVHNLSVYINGYKVGYMPATNYFVSEPECDDQNCARFSYDLYYPEEEVLIQIYDEDDYLVFECQEIIQSGSCNLFHVY